MSISTDREPSVRWPPLRIVQWGTVIAILVISELVAIGGRNGLSWAIDGAAAAVAGAFTLIRRR